MRLQKKSISKIALLDLLRRKRTTLNKFLSETGIVTYDLLVARCSSVGILPPTEAQFLKAMGNPVIHEISSPTEGIVVLQPQMSNQEEDEQLKDSEVDFSQLFYDDNTSSTESAEPEQEGEVSLSVKKKKRKKSIEESRE